jgi:predicted RNase H-like HicB family nuclease
MMVYTVVLTPDPEDGGWNVTVPALPGCFTNAETVDEALARAKEAIEVYLNIDDVTVVQQGADGAIVTTVAVGAAS